ncbi:hypothetical protein BsWGS_19136 [Bradybaena similaris]
MEECLYQKNIYRQKIGDSLDNLHHMAWRNVYRQKIGDRLDNLHHMAWRNVYIRGMFISEECLYQRNVYRHKTGDRLDNLHHMAWRNVYIRGMFTDRRLGTDLITCTTWHGGMFYIREMFTNKRLGTDMITYTAWHGLYEDVLISSLSQNHCPVYLPILVLVSFCHLTLCLCVFEKSFKILIFPHMFVTRRLLVIP